MAIFAKFIESYQIENEEHDWRARGVVYTTDGKLETQEFIAKTKQEAEKKARKAIDGILKKFNESS